MDLHFLGKSSDPLRDIYQYSNQVLYIYSKASVTQLKRTRQLHHTHACFWKSYSFQNKCTIMNSWMDSDHCMSNLWAIVCMINSVTGNRYFQIIDY